MDSSRQRRDSLKATSKAFTLIELLLSVSLVSMLMVISVPFYQSFQQSNELSAAQDISERVLRTAKTYARESNNESDWGVYFINGEAILFKGTTYATRDTSFDISYGISSRVVYSSITEVSFTYPDGAPSSTGILTLSVSGKSESITINDKSIL